MKLKIRRILSTGAVAAALLWAGVANAALYQFTLTGDFLAQWQLNTGVAPNLDAPGLGLAINDVPVVFASITATSANIAFYSDIAQGGLMIFDRSGMTQHVSAQGPQLYYSGTERAPLYKLGVFSLTEGGGAKHYTLAITDLSVTPVPEPETYLMLLAGLGLMAGLARRRRNG
ncbi:hypothetical protein Jab_2c04920 [Janthinobacterium sp. HH01]|uniref:PEP-CTERM sorting domain-containing protein n=1 Tax=Janthinobacterium sp. HH01 TaxID=1198452 RepID=UPI0002AEAEB4|nr:PEP-CTERM sorting domain-containing protein [Janthinobacterium sp. HH01]ELX08443.1 hypothetical protein Jab_2c04920 [Janthinobacterium sp. HH01]